MSLEVPVLSFNERLITHTIINRLSFVFNQTRRINLPSFKGTFLIKIGWSLVFDPYIELMKLSLSHVFGMLAFGKVIIQVVKGTMSFDSSLMLLDID